MPNRMGDPELDAMLDEMQRVGYMDYDDVHDFLNFIPPDKQESELRRIYANFLRGNGE